MSRYAAVSTIFLLMLDARLQAACAMPPAAAAAARWRRRLSLLRFSSTLHACALVLLFASARSVMLKCPFTFNIFFLFLQVLRRRRG
jgi:hypothetical protein